MYVIAPYCIPSHCFYAKAPTSLLRTSPCNKTIILVNSPEAINMLSTVHPGAVTTHHSVCKQNISLFTSYFKSCLDLHQLLIKLCYLAFKQFLLSLLTCMHRCRHRFSPLHWHVTGNVTNCLHFYIHTFNSSVCWIRFSWAVCKSMERKGLATYILYRVGNMVSSTNLKGVAFLFFGLQMLHCSF